MCCVDWSTHPLPLTSERYLSVLSCEERRAVYDYCVATAKATNKMISFPKEQLVLLEDQDDKTGSKQYHIIIVAVVWMAALSFKLLSIFALNYELYCPIVSKLTYSGKTTKNQLKNILHKILQMQLFFDVVVYSGEKAGDLHLFKGVEYMSAFSADDQRKDVSEHLQQLMEERDMKRKRQKHRAKNVHITQKSHNEVGHDDKMSVWCGSTPPVKVGWRLCRLLWNTQCFLYWRTFILKVLNTKVLYFKMSKTRIKYRCVLLIFKIRIKFSYRKG